MIETTFDPNAHIAGLPMKTLLGLHRAIAAAIHDDDTKPVHMRCYRVRETGDWKRQARAIEDALKMQGVPIKALAF